MLFISSNNKLATTASDNETTQIILIMYVWGSNVAHSSEQNKTEYQQIKLIAYKHQLHM